MRTNLTEFDDLLDSVLDPVLWVVTARFGDEQSGLIATFVQKASLVPALPRMVTAIARHHLPHAGTFHDELETYHQLGTTAARRLQHGPGTAAQVGHPLRRKRSRASGARRLHTRTSGRWTPAGHVLDSRWRMGRR